MKYQVKRVYKNCMPGKTGFTGKGVDAVLEVPANFGIKEGQIITVEENDMKQDLSWSKLSERNLSRIAQGRGFGPGGLGLGPGGACICPDCGFEIPHERAEGCVEKACPECGALMERDANRKGMNHWEVLAKRFAEAGVDVTFQDGHPVDMKKAQHGEWTGSDVDWIVNDAVVRAVKQDSSIPQDMAKMMAEEIMVDKYPGDINSQTLANTIVEGWQDIGGGTFASRKKAQARPEMVSGYPEQAGYLWQEYKSGKAVDEIAADMQISVDEVQEVIDWMSKEASKKRAQISDILNAIDMIIAGKITYDAVNDESLIDIRNQIRDGIASGKYTAPVYQSALEDAEKAMMRRGIDIMARKLAQEYKEPREWETVLGSEWPNVLSSIKVRMENGQSPEEIYNSLVDPEKGVNLTVDLVKEIMKYVGELKMEAKRQAQATEDEQAFAEEVAKQISEFAGDEKDVGQIIEMIKGKTFTKEEKEADGEENNQMATVPDISGIGTFPPLAKERVPSGVFPAVVPSVKPQASRTFLETEIIKAARSGMQPKDIASVMEIPLEIVGEIVKKAQKYQVGDYIEGLGTVSKISLKTDKIRYGILLPGGDVPSWYTEEEIIERWNG